MTDRREHPTLLWLPAIIATTIILLLAGWAGHRDYRSAHPTPKPTVAGPAIIPYTKLTAEPAVTHVECGPQSDGWTVCGLYPADPRPVQGLQRPRKHKRKANEWTYRALMNYAPPSSNVEDYNPHTHLTMRQLKNLQESGNDCVLRVNGSCWITLDPDPPIATPPTDEVHLEVQPSTIRSSEWNRSTILQYVFTQEQASRLGNEWIKQCGPENRDQACYTPDILDPKARHD